MSTLGQAKQTAPPAPPSRRQSIEQNVRESSRRILVTGPSGSGKSTLSASASSYAGDVLPLKEPVVAKDVAVLQGDIEGMMGALSVGIRIPNVFDYTRCETWEQYSKQVVADLKELKPEVARGDIRYIILDLALPDLLAVEHVKPKTINDWTQVRLLGKSLFSAFTILEGCTIIGNAQIRAAESAVETQAAKTASEALTYGGGSRSAFVMDLSKGIGSLWRHHNSLHCTTERRAVRVGVGKDAKTVMEGSIYIQPSARYEAKSRFGDKLKPVEPFTRTLNSMLKQVYGDAL